MEADALKEKVVAIFEKLDVTSQLNALKLATGSVKRTPQSLSSFREETTASRFGILKETCEK